MKTNERMNIWLKSAIEAFIGLALWYLGSCLWTIRFTRILFIGLFEDPRRIQGVLDIANTNRPLEDLTEQLREQREEQEMAGKEHYSEETSTIAFDSTLPMMQLAALVPATFEAWQKVRNRLIGIALCLVIASFFISPYLVLLNLFITLIVARYLGFHSRAYSDALGALLPIVKIVARWIERDPEGCRKWCTESSTRFRTLYQVVSSDATVQGYIAKNSIARA
jgi:hypothetical protein